MMNRRVMVNLAFFTSIGVFLGWWALTNVLQMDLRHPPYQLTADFEDSPGLQPGYDVGYLGTPIGRIRSVDLANGHVRVVMSIDHGREIPQGSTLTVRRKSAVGEPYVDVTPPEGATEDSPMMEPGSHVAMSHTETPLSYSDLFHALHQLVSTVPADDLGRLMHEMANGLDGRAGSLRDLITGSSDAVHTFAENAPLIDETMRNLSRLVQVFAEHRDSFGQSLHNAREFTGGLADANRDLERVLTDGNDLATRTADLIAGSEGNVTCIFGDLSRVAIRLGSPETAQALAEILSTSDSATDVWQDIIAWEDDGPYIRAVPPLNAGGERPIRVYQHPHQLPAVAQAPSCPDMSPNGAPGGGDAASGAGGGQADAGPSGAVDPGPTQHLNGEQASSDQNVDEGGFNPLIAVGLLLGAALLFAVRPWRWLPSLKRG